MTNGLKILTFIFFTVLLHVLIFLLFDKITTNRSELMMEEKNLTEFGSVDLLIIGDSHAKRSIDASQLRNAFNAAYFGENPALTYYHLMHIVNDLNIQPKTILLQIDMTRMAKNFLKHYKNKFFYQGFVDNDELLKQNVISNEEWLENQLLKILPHLEFYTALKRTTNRETNATKTFASFTKAQQIRMAHNFVFKQLIPGGYSDLYDTTAISYLKKTIQFCQKNDIQIIAIKYPVTDIYLTTIAEICQRDLDFSSPQEIIIKELNIPIIDLENAFKLDYELFSDSHHMNLKGKMACTDLFKKELKSLQNFYNAKGSIIP